MHMRTISRDTNQRVAFDAIGTISTCAQWQEPQINVWVFDTIGIISTPMLVHDQQVEV